MDQLDCDCSGLITAHDAAGSGRRCGRGAASRSAVVSARSERSTSARLFFPGCVGVEERRHGIVVAEDAPKAKLGQRSVLPTTSGAGVDEGAADETSRSARERGRRRDRSRNVVPVRRSGVDDFFDCLASVREAAPPRPDGARSWVMKSRPNGSVAHGHEGDALDLRPSRQCTVSPSTRRASRPAAA